MDESALDSALSLVADCHSNWTSNNIIIPVFSSLDSDEVIELDLCQTLRSPDRDMHTTRKRARRNSHSSGGEFPFEVCQVSNLPNLPNIPNTPNIPNSPNILNMPNIPNVTPWPYTTTYLHALICCFYQVYWLTKDWLDDSEETRKHKIIPHFVHLCARAGFSLVSNGFQPPSRMGTWKILSLRCSRGFMKRKKVRIIDWYHIVSLPVLVSDVYTSSYILSFIPSHPFS
jgi:hypothetical protein